MEKSTEKSVSSVASGNSINSKLRYPLRSALRSREGKPPVPDFSASSAPRRGRVASAVSQSTTALDFSAAKKSVDRTKPPRRLSIPTKTSSNSSVKSASTITSVSESKAKRSANARSFNETPVSSVLRSVTRKKVEDLSSSTYWLSHIKLAESVAKHSISLGFFKLALHSGCEPLDQMKEELKSYARRNNLDGLEDAMKELSELYHFSEESKQMQISETSSVLAEETTVSLNFDKDVQSSLSTPGNSNITSEIMKEDDLQDLAVTETAKEEEASETIPQGRTRKSLDVINVNQEDVSEVVQETEDGVPMVTAVQPSDKKRANRKETASKNNMPARTKKPVATYSGNSRTVPENKSQKKDERITKPRTKKIQEETKKSTKKPAAKEGEVKTLKQMKKMENKENSVVGAGEEIQA
ncbi:hypothetical protein EUTSA_v10004313mg [Eutrema salsugineum]|uniref:Uncharacterized protein n=1 Tax=Eutrema salsugineum TaxID=72664 RepID=V4MJV7_EUTSA|nr:uncharacterized protein LOC18012292 [Eutrema salsugineum]ESQ31666.1 hypothetical protein EUTSA_v10004313mg [Eutrema salsugineum]